MAAISAIADGRWFADAATVWSGGVAPTSADQVTIGAGRTVTLDTTGLNADTISLSGTLTAGTSASWDLRMQNDLTVNSGGHLNLDMSGAAASVVGTIKLNASNNASPGRGIQITSGRITGKGVVRKRSTQMAGAIVAGNTSCVVDDATGWQVGDRIVLASTQSYAQATYSVTSVSWSGGFLTCNVASSTGLVKGMRVNFTSFQTNLNFTWVVYDVPSGTTFRIQMADPSPITDGVGTATTLPKFDAFTIATITAGSGTTATITWSDGAGTGGGVAFDHADDCYVGNFSSNLVIKADVAGSACFVNHNPTSTLSIYSHAVFESLNQGSFGLAGIAFNAGGLLNGINDCAFYDYRYCGVWLRFCTAVNRSRNIYYATQGSTNVLTGQAGTCVGGGADVDTVVFASGNGVVDHAQGDSWTRMRASGVWQQSVIEPGTPAGNTHRDCDYWSNRDAIGSFSGGQASSGFFESCRIGSLFSAANENQFGFNNGQAGIIVLRDCTLSGGNFHRSGSLPVSRPFAQIVLANKNLDPLVQEVYTNISTTTPTLQRDNSVYYGSSGSSLKVNTSAVAQDITVRFKVFAPAGTPILVPGRIRRSSASIPVTVTLSGLGATPTTYTCTETAGTWELAALMSTNPTATDGMMDVIVTVTSGVTGSVNLDAFNPPPPAAISTGDFSYWSDGQPISLLASNFVSAADVWGTALSGLTVVGSVGEWVRKLLSVAKFLALK